MSDLLESIAFSVAAVVVLLVADWRYGHESEETRKAREKWEWRHRR